MPDIRFAEITERKQIEELCSQDKAVKDFKFNWTRWGHWLAGNYPIALISSDMVYGFHAAVFNKRNGYVNSYYQYVHTMLRGKGYGAAMVDFLLFNAQSKNCVRLKFQTPINSSGQAFWMGFGLKPFGRTDSHIYFDIDISGVYDVFGLSQLKPHRFAWKNFPLTSQRTYTQKGIRLIEGD